MVSVDVGGLHGPGVTPPATPRATHAQRPTAVKASSTEILTRDPAPPEVLPRLTVVPVSLPEAVGFGSRAQTQSMPP